MEVAGRFPRSLLPRGRRELGEWAQDEHLEPSKRRWLVSSFRLAALRYLSMAPPEILPIKLITDYLKAIVKLDAVRESPESLKLVGRYKLGANAGNLPQVLNSIAASRRNIFNAILNDAAELLPEFSEVRSPAVEGQDMTSLSVTQRTWPDTEFRWAAIASGTKEVLYLLTLVHIAPRGTLILIEEPELHLHPEAIRKLRDIVFRRALSQGKQLVMTTHSLTLIDNLHFEKILYVLREKGVTRAIQVGSFKEVEELLTGAEIPKSVVLAPESQILIVIVEGRDDVKVWRQFLTREGFNLNSRRVKIVPGLRSGGREEVMSALGFLAKLGPPVKCFAILDADARATVSGKQFVEIPKSGNVHVLARGEIEDYLIDSSAIAKLVNRPQNEVEAVVGKIRGRGKDRLDAILKELGLSKTSPEVKELLAVNLPNLPPEILEVIGKIGAQLDITQN